MAWGGDVLSKIFLPTNITKTAARKTSYYIEGCMGIDFVRKYGFGKNDAEDGDVFPKISICF